MSQNCVWNKQIGMYNGYRATQITQKSKDGKEIKSDIYIDLNGDNIPDIKVFKSGKTSSVFTSYASDGKSGWEFADKDFEHFEKGNFVIPKKQVTTEPTQNTNKEEIEKTVEQKAVVPQENAEPKTPVEKKEAPAEAKTTASTEYIVNDGDIFSVIARKNGFTTAELAKHNKHIKNIGEIKRGDKIIIPAKTESVKNAEPAISGDTKPVSENVATATQAQKAETKKTERELIIHKLKPGETLGDLAEKYNLSVYYIKKLNGISDKEERRLRDGREIKVYKNDLKYTDVDKANIELLKNSIVGDEGLELKAYQCPAKKWTIGYGHTAGVEEGQTITKAEAEKYLQADLKNAYDDLKILMFEENIENLDPGKTRALVDLIFNVGVNKVRGSKLMSYIKQGKYKEAQAELDYFSAGGVVQAGLIKRRISGMKEFLNGEITPTAKTKVITAINKYLGTKATSWNQAINLLKKHDKHDIAILMQQLPNVASN